MRKAAGIMLIIFGGLSFMVPSRIVGVIAWVRASSIEEWLDIQLEMNTGMLLTALLLTIVIVGGGICTLVKRYYGWAFSGAVCLILAGITVAAFWSLDLEPIGGALAGVLMGVLYAVPGLLAVIFLVERKGEFQRLPPSEHKLVGE